MDKATKEQLNMVREQPVPSQRRSFEIDFNGWLHVDLLPTGRRLWVLRFRDKSKKRRQVTLGELSAMSYRQASLKEAAILTAAW